MPEEGKTKFRKYAASVMASATISAILYGWISGLVTTAEGGAFTGAIVAFAAKYLWEESGV